VAAALYFGADVMSTYDAELADVAAGAGLWVKQPALICFQHARIAWLVVRWRKWP
jgi:hypothetical protein